MNAIEDLKEKRFLFLNRAYELSEGSERKYLSPGAIGEELGFDTKLWRDILDYLKAEGLITVVDLKRTTITISHAGIVEVEAALGDPNRPTHYFPPAVNIINVN